MEANDPGTVPPPSGAGDAGEARGERLKRHSQRARLYGVAFALVALLVCLVALILANTRRVKLSWLFGDTNASLVWIILASAILGWLLGLATSIAFRRRTRRLAGGS
ncbi:MAG: hypothetical protein QOF50_1791 [Gaiellaceae bacterium]|nr:hypothetical protein [Gaiellaceae bacterium]